MSARYATAEKSMEEILASIRETIEQNVDQKQTAGGPMSNQKSTQKAQETQEQEDDVFELTQVVNEDGSISSMESESSEIETTTGSNSRAGSNNYTAESTEEVYDPSAYAFTENSDESVFFDSEASTGTETIGTTGTGTTGTGTGTTSTGTTGAKAYQAGGFDLEATEPQETMTVGTASRTSSGAGASSDIGDAGLISETVAQAAGAALSDLSRAVSTGGSMPSGAAQSGSKPLTADNLGQNTIDGLMRELLRPMLKDWLDAHLPSLVKWIVTEQIEKIIQEQRKDS